MPFFDGNQIFGIASVSTGEAERDSQRNDFFGLNGTEVLDGGFRRRMTSVHGLHRAANGGGLAAIQGVFRSYEDGHAYVLVDSLGVTWRNVRLVSFRPVPPIRVGTDGTTFQEYDATFEHLTFS